MDRPNLPPAADVATALITAGSIPLPPLHPAALFCSPAHDGHHHLRWRGLRCNLLAALQRLTDGRRRRKTRASAPRTSTALPVAASRSPCRSPWSRQVPRRRCRPWRQRQPSRRPQPTASATAPSIGGFVVTSPGHRGFDSFPITVNGLNAAALARGTAWLILVVVDKAVCRETEQRARFSLSCPALIEWFQRLSSSPSQLHHPHHSSFI
ncbi:hypothetical protein ACP70R_042266 [Stipagrostis hirtigluma subsp. patula]